MTRASAAIVAALAWLASAPRLSAQLPRRPDPVGTWRGTSLCTLRPSPCHDEVVVYRITPTATRDSVAMDARKIVNGAEEEMAVLGCIFVPRSAELTCRMPNGVWRFTIRGDSLVGDLRLPDGRKFRDVRTSRSPVPPRAAVTPPAGQSVDRH